MKPISDDDLVLLYYGEHEDPGLATRVAGDEELSRRFDAIGAELGQLDSFAPPPRDEDYGAATWQAISARLADGESRPGGFRESVRNVLARPRFSLAGVAAVAFVAVLAFLLGHTSGNTDNQPLFILLHLCQPSYKAKGLLLGFGSDGAGVDDDVIGSSQI